MTAKLKPGRPKSPCSKCGGMERDASGNCKPCYRAYMREYRKKWIADRKMEMKKIEGESK